MKWQKTGKRERNIKEMLESIQLTKPNFSLLMNETNIALKVKR
jgi:hypothetical protein